MILISCIRRSYIRQGKSPFWTYDLSRYTWELICPFCIHQTTHHLPWKNHPSRLHQLKYNAHSVEAMVRKGEQEPMWRFLNLYQLYYTPIVYHPGSPCSWINTCIWCYLSWFGFEVGWKNHWITGIPWNLHKSWLFLSPTFFCLVFLDFWMDEHSFSNTDLGHSEIRAAREAECHNSPSLFRNLCIKNTVTAATNNMFSKRGKECANQMFEFAIKDRTPLIPRATSTRPNGSRTDRFSGEQKLEYQCCRWQ